MTTAVVVFPGRGSYGPATLGWLARHFPDPALRDRLEARRAEMGHEALSALDAAPAFDPARHGRGENLNALIYAAALGDFLALDGARIEVVAVAGNSMGWYAALAAAGAVAPEDGLRIAATTGARLGAAAIGGQVIHRWMDDDWTPDPAPRAALLALADAIAGRPGHALALSIDLGGYLVFAGNEAGLAAFAAEAPPAPGGYPMRLAGHAAFHSPLQAGVSAGLRAELPAALFGRGRLPMVDGRGHVWWPGTYAGGDLHAYTLGDQVVAPYDFTAAIRTAAREFAPDLFVLTGPGATLGGPVAQALVLARWRGIDGRAAFRAEQARRPLLAAMGDPAQRRTVTRGADP
jgi:acyl transferase domain-containing protein